MNNEEKLVEQINQKLKYNCEYITNKENIKGFIEELKENDIDIKTFLDCDVEIELKTYSQIKDNFDFYYELVDMMNRYFGDNCTNFYSRALSMAVSVKPKVVKNDLYFVQKKLKDNFEDIPKEKLKGFIEELEENDIDIETFLNSDADYMSWYVLQDEFARLYETEYMMERILGENGTNFYSESLDLAVSIKEE